MMKDQLDKEVVMDFLQDKAYFGSVVETLCQIIQQVSIDLNSIMVKSLK
jgi:hypothetical protein